MRGGNAVGRFDAEYETHSIWDGISRDLQRPVGQDVYWYHYNPTNTEVDPIYDVGSPQGGRAYDSPVRLPVVNALVTQGQQWDNDRGFYTVDVLRLIVNFADVQKSLPLLPTNPDLYLKDRVIFRNGVFAPNRVNQRGQVEYHYMTLTVDMTQLKPEEVFNDVWSSEAPTWLINTFKSEQELGNYGDGTIE